MAKFIARRIILGIGKETTRGTAVSPSFWLPLLSNDYDDTHRIDTFGERFGLLGGFGEETHIRDKKADGDFQCEVDADAFGLLLLTVFGTSTPAGPTDSAYTHTFTLDTTTAHDSLTLVEVNPINYYQYTLAMLERLDIIVEPEEIITCVARFKSRTSSTISDPGAAYSTRKLFLGRHFSFKIAATTGDLAAADTISLRRFRLIFRKNLVEAPRYSTFSSEDLFNQMFEIEGSIDLAYENRNYHDYIANETTKALRIQFTSDELIGATSVPQFTLDLSKVSFESWAPDKKNDDITMESIDFKALYDDTNSNIVNSCTLINETASY